MIQNCISYNCSDSIPFFCSKFDVIQSKQSIYNEPLNTDTYHYALEPYVTIGGVNLTLPTTVTIERDVIPDDYGENELVPIVAFQPTLKIEAVDFPLEKKLFKEDRLFTKYAQFRLEKFIFNPYKGIGFVIILII